MMCGQRYSLMRSLLLCFLVLFVSGVPSAAWQHSLPSQAFNAKPSTVATTAVAVASSYVGTCEQGYNRGPIVSRIIREAGGRDGQSWCMWFMVYCYDRAAQRHGVSSPLIRTGSCWTQLRAALLPGSRCAVIVPSLPGRFTSKPGDVTIHSRGSARRTPGQQFLGHTEIVLDDLGTSISAVGGNTSCSDRGSQSDGDCVCRKRRVKASRTMPIVALLRPCP